MIKVLHIVTWMNRGGIETWLIRFIREAHRLGEFQVDILCRAEQSGTLAHKAEELGAKVTVMPMKLATKSNINKLATLLQVEKYDIVHSHVNSHNSLAVKAAKYANIPSVAMYHNERLEAAPERAAGLLRHILARLYVRKNLRYAIRNASLVAPVSQAVQRALSAYCKDSTRPNRVIYLGVDHPPKLCNTEMDKVRSEVFQASPEQFVILHVGAFAHQKNHESLLSTLQYLRDLGVAVKLVLVGDGQRWDEISNLIKSHRYSQDIIALGARDDINRLMASADCFLLPSWHEGLPITVMEAFANGLPIVASDIPSIREALGSDYEIDMASPSDAQKFASIIKNLASNSDLRVRLAEKGRRRFEERFSIDASYDSLTTAYRELLSGSLS
jgi:glycosyltransferase EpsF